MNDIPPIAIIAVAGIIAVIVLFIGIRSVRSEKDVIEERLESFQGSGYSLLEMPDDEQLAETANEKVEKSLGKRLNSSLESRSMGQKWRTQLARADIKLKPIEYLGLHFVSIIGFFLVGFFLLSSQQLVTGIVAGFAGFFFPRIYVARAAGKRLVNFEQQLPDTLSLWVNALRSGYSVLQSMEAIGRDAPEPTATEFKRVVQEVQLGIDQEDALQHLLDRVESEDLDLVATAVNIQREVGGNLAEILDVITNTIRERVKLKGEIRVLTAQGRITGYLIAGLPILLALFLNGINPKYMGNLFQNPSCGWPMLGLGLVLIGMGWAVIQKIVDIDI